MPGSLLAKNTASFACLYTQAPCTATQSLQGNSSTTPEIANVAGYVVGADGGGGDFYNLGGASTNCASYNNSATLDGNTVNLTVGSDPTEYMRVGESVMGTGIPVGAQIASILSNTSITITLTATVSGSTTVNISGNNGGTLVVDSAMQCWQKTNYRGEPHEWGAVGDGLTNDTLALEKWLGAYGAASSAFSSGAVATNFGPWVATLPANYLVTNPLVCPPNADIESRANMSAGHGSPPVRIFANSFTAVSNPFTDSLGLPALMTADDFCRIGGIALDASNLGNFYQTGLEGTISTSLDVTTIVLSAAPPPGTAVGMPISDNGSLGLGLINPGSTITAINTDTLTITPHASAGSGTDYVTITGLDTLDIAGEHVSVDNRSLLEGGYANLRCGNPLQFEPGLQVKDSEINGGTDEGIHLGGCANTRLTGDLISGNGVGGSGFAVPPPDGNGVSSGGQDLTVSNGVIEQSGGVGLSLSTANLVSVTGMYFDNNGKVVGGSGIDVSGSTYVTVAGNHFHRNGGGAPGSSQVFFSGSSDNVELAANVYYPDNTPDEATLRPSYDYDAASGTILTNAHIYEQPSPQAAGTVFSATTGELLLAPLQVPQITNEITGLTLSNPSTTS